MQQASSSDEDDASLPQGAGADEEAGDEEEEEGEEAQSSAGGERGRAPAAASGHSAGGQASAQDPERGWAPEEYEEDRVRGVVPAYLKFSQRLQRRPDQCARYGCWELRQLLTQR